MKYIKRIAIAILGLVVIGVAGFFLGPRPHFDSVDPTPSTERYDITQLESIIAQRESTVQYLKENNESRMIWADSTKSRRPYSIVYLHGFSASPMEGDPVHQLMAEQIGANLYLPRLPEHGVEYPDAMKDLTPVDLIDAAKDAIAIGKTLGEKVIVMGCSTGGTLAIYLAAHDDDIDAVMLLSPNIAIHAEQSKMLTGPWGRQLAYRMIGERRDMRDSQEVPQYWSTLYHTNGLIALQALLDMTMKEEYFEALQMPVYCGYYEGDRVVSTEAIKEFLAEVTEDNEQVEIDVFAQGDHVLGSDKKNIHWEQVREEIESYVEEHFRE